MDAWILLRKKYRGGADPALFGGLSDFLDFPQKNTVWQTWPGEVSIWIKYKYAEAYQGYVLAR